MFSLGCSLSFSIKNALILLSRIKWKQTAPTTYAPTLAYATDRKLIDIYTVKTSFKEEYFGWFFWIWKMLTKLMMMLASQVVRERLGENRTWRHRCTQWKCPRRHFDNKKQKPSSTCRCVKVPQRDIREIECTKATQSIWIKPSCHILFMHSFFILHCIWDVLMTVSIGISKTQLKAEKACVYGI